MSSFIVWLCRLLHNRYVRSTSLFVVWFGMTTVWYVCVWNDLVTVVSLYEYRILQHVVCLNDTRANKVTPDTPLTPTLPWLSHIRVFYAVYQENAFVLRCIMLRLYKSNRDLVHLTNLLVQLWVSPYYDWRNSSAINGRCHELRELFNS